MRFSIRHATQAVLALALAVLFTAHIASSSNASPAPGETTAVHHQPVPEAFADAATQSIATAINFTAGFNTAPPTESHVTQSTDASPAKDTSTNDQSDQPAAERWLKGSASAKTKRESHKTGQPSRGQHGTRGEITPIDSHRYKAQFPDGRAAAREVDRQQTKYTLTKSRRGTEKRPRLAKNWHARAPEGSRRKQRWPQFLA